MPKSDEPIELKPMAFFDKGSPEHQGLAKDFSPKVTRLDAAEEQEAVPSANRQVGTLHEGAGANIVDDLNPGATAKGVQNPPSPEAPDEEAPGADGATPQVPDDLIPDLGPDLAPAKSGPGSR